MYKIYQFILYELDNYIAIQNSVAFNIIKNEEIINFFKYLDANNILRISNEDILDFFDNNSEEIISYLLDSSLIYEENISFKDYSKINIITNDKVIYDSICFNSNGSLKEIFSIYCKNKKIMRNELLGINTDCSDILYIIVLNPFDYNFFNDLNDILEEKNVMYNFAIPYNNSFYITNIHKKDWKNPCPKCFFAHLEASLRAYNKNTMETTFQTVVDIIYNNNVLFDFEMPSNHRLILDLVNTIISYDTYDVKNVTGRITKINLYDGLEYDQAIHWELCNCYE